MHAWRVVRRFGKNVRKIGVIGSQVCTSALTSLAMGSAHTLDDLASASLQSGKRIGQKLSRKVRIALKRVYGLVAASPVADIVPVTLPRAIIGNVVALFLDMKEITATGVPFEDMETEVLMERLTLAYKGQLQTFFTKRGKIESQHQWIIGSIDTIAAISSAVLAALLTTHIASQIGIVGLAEFALFFGVSLCHAGMWVLICVPPLLICSAIVQAIRLYFAERQHGKSLDGLQEMLEKIWPRVQKKVASLNSENTVEGERISQQMAEMYEIADLLPPETAARARRTLEASLI